MARILREGQPTKNNQDPEDDISTGMVFWSMSREFIPTERSENEIVEDNTLLSSEVIFTKM